MFISDNNRHLFSKLDIFSRVMDEPMVVTESLSPHDENEVAPQQDASQGVTEVTEVIIPEVITPEVTKSHKTRSPKVTRSPQVPKSPKSPKNDIIVDINNIQNILDNKQIKQKQKE